MHPIDESIDEKGRRVWRGPDGQTWTDPGPNEPIRARPGWLTKLLAARANTTTPTVVGASRADQRGGSAAFKINGLDPQVTQARGYLRADGSWCEVD